MRPADWGTFGSIDAQNALFRSVRVCPDAISGAESASSVNVVVLESMCLCSFELVQSRIACVHASFSLVVR